jgi:hypothetical protein
MMASRSEALGRLRSSTLEPDGWAANWSHALVCQESTRPAAHTIASHASKILRAHTLQLCKEITR